MALQLTQLRIPNLSTDFSAETNAAAGLAKTVAGLPAQWQKQNALAGIGEDLKAGNYDSAAQKLLASGDTDGAMKALALGEGRRKLAAGEAATQGLLGAIGLGGAPSAAGVGPGSTRPSQQFLGQPAQPKQGVHVAENEDDVQRLERATGMVVTDEDRQAVVRTVFGEAANQPAVGQQAVAAVIRNRANQAGMTPADIVLQKNQFEPWNTEAGRARMNSIPEQRFAQIAGTVAPVLEQGLDPTGGATHFYAPKAQAMLGRAAPKWDNGTGNDIADHRFFSLGYGQGGGAPAPAPSAIIASAQGLPEPTQVAQNPGFLGNAPPPSTGFTPQGQPAPTQVAQVPQQPFNGIGYGGFTTQQLTGYLNSPQVPPHIKQQMQAELDKRQGGGSAPAQVAQAQDGGVQPVPGDDPVKLRQDAAYYDGTNPEAARQFRARADAAERAGGVQTAQAAPQPGSPAADMPAQGAAPAQDQPSGFRVPQGRPATREDAIERKFTADMEAAKGKVQALTKALANPNLPANVREIGGMYLKEALEQSKAPESVREFLWSRAMGLTQAKSPAEYAREKATDDPQTQVERRRMAAEAAGLQPGDPRYESYLLTGSAPAAAKTAATERTDRKAAAADMGIRPGDPRYEAFVLTGKMPREDMGSLTATDKKAILEADEGVMSAQTAIQALRDAKTISPRALAGFGAGARATAANALPDWMVPDGMVASKAQGEATAELENIVTSQALAQLKSIFGAAPTEGERRILMEIQGSIGQPDNVRQKIYDRGIAMAERRLGFNQQRANELRGGDFYRPENKRGQGGQGVPAGRQGAPAQSAQPDLSQARQGSDGNFYVPDPARAGKFLMVQP